MHHFDPQELAKFSEHASRWWDIEGPLKTLHQINPLRLNYINEKANLNHKHVIDVGCGGGILTESMASTGAQVTGIDLNKSLIEVAKLHQLENGKTIEYLCTPVETLADERPGFYDVVTCLEMLEHVDNPFIIIKACAKLVKPGGHVFFSTLNRNPKSYLFAVIGAEYLLRLLPTHTHDYSKFIKPSELHQWCLQANLIPKEMKGISYQPFTQQFSLTNDISINYLFYAHKQ